MASSKRTGGLVYSTEHGRLCPACKQPLAQCACRPEPEQLSRAGNVVVRRESKGRRGKDVTVVSGVPLGTAKLQALAKTLKQRCGSGGTVKDGKIEIQGDHRDSVIPLLAARGWTVKRG